MSLSYIVAGVRWESGSAFREATESVRIGNSSPGNYFVGVLMFGRGKKSRGAHAEHLARIIPHRQLGSP